MGIDRDAVAAYAYPRLVDVRVRLAVGRRDDFLDVDAGAVGESGELVCQRDVDVSVGRVRELAELGGLGAAHGHDLRVEHGVVEDGRASRGFRTDAAHELGVRGQVGEHRARIQPLRREGHEQVVVPDDASGSLEPRQKPAPRVPDGECRLEDHGQTGVDAARDRRHGRIHEAVVGLVGLVEHDRHDEHRHIRVADRFGGVRRCA